MKTTKFHKASGQGLKEPYGNIDIHTVPRLGIPTDASKDDFENEYLSNVPINIKKLIKDLKSNYFEHSKFDAKNYIDHDAIERARDEAIKARKQSAIQERIQQFEKVRDRIPEIKPHLKQLKPAYKPLSEQEIQNIQYRLLASSISLNTCVDFIDNKVNKNEYKVHIDIFSDSIIYEYYIFYKTSEQAKNRDKAILINSNDPGIIFFFLEKVYGKTEADKLRKSIYEKFIEELENAKNIDRLIYLHEHLPHYIKYAFDIDKDTGRKLFKLPDELLWENFMFFVNFDKWHDASYYVLFIMTLITPKYCIEKFRENQNLVIQIYDGLDDRNFIDRLFGDYEYSETFNIGKSTLEISNKDVFVTLLNSYLQFLENNDAASIFESSGAHFHQGAIKRGNIDEDYGFEAEYWLKSDIEDNRIYLKNLWKSKKNLGPSFYQSGTTPPPAYAYDRGYNEEGFYNPLDIVKFTLYSDRGEAITMNAPAILVYHADYVEDWERIHEGIRFGTNVLMIVVGVATLHTGLGSLMLYATIADIGLASTDIIIQSEKNKIKRLEGGQEFLESWEKIYTVGGAVTFSPVAIKAVTTYSPKMLNSGADLLQVTRKTITNPQTYKKVKDLTTKAVHSLEIPNFNKTGLEILKKGFKSIPELSNASKLQELGVVFVKGGENTMAAIYKGVVIAYGKVQIVALQLRRAIQKLRGKPLEEYLEELRYLGGMAENIRTTKNVDAFLASQARLATLKITSKNALKYLDEALPHFNHKVVENIVNGVVEKVVVKIGDENCASVAKVVDEYLKTGKITKAEPIGLSGFDFFGKDVGDFSQLSLLSMQKVMKEGERGIIFGELGRRPSFQNGEAILQVFGHYFNVVKKDGILLLKDGQIGRNAVIGFKQYKEYRYLKTN